MVATEDKSSNSQTQSNFKNEIEAQKALYGIDTCEDILFNMTDQMYYLLTKEDIEKISKDEKEFSNALKPIEKLKKQLASDKEVNETQINDAKAQTQEKLKGLGIKAGSANDLTEIRRLKGKKMTYIRSNLLKNHKRYYKLDADDRKRSTLKKDGKFEKKAIREALSKSAVPKASVKIKLLEDEIKEFSTWANQISGSLKDKNGDEGYHFGDKEYLKNPNRKFDASIDAQWMRFAAGAEMYTDFSPWDEKGKFDGKVALGAKADSSFALAEGKMEVTAYLPKEGGQKLELPLLDEKTGDPLNLGIVRVDIQARLEGFVGASAMLDVGVKIDASNKSGLELLEKNMLTQQEKDEGKTKPHKDKDFAGAGADVFAGATAGCKANATLQWKNIEKKNDFCALGQAGYGMNVSAGLGAKGEFKLMIGDDGKFYFKASAGLVCGVGASGQMSCMVNGNTIIDVTMFVYHQLMDKNYNYQDFIEREAFTIISAYMVKHMMEPINNIIDVCDEAYAVGNDAKDNLITWWDYVIIDKTEEVTDLANNILNDKQGLMRFSTPEAKGKMLAILTVDYSSQLKYLTEREELHDLQERAIIKLMKWCQSQKEVNHVYTNIKLDSEEKLSKEDGKKKLMKIVDGQEKKEYLTWWDGLPPMEAFSKGKVVAMVPNINYPVDLKGAYSNNIGYA